MTNAGALESSCKMVAIALLSGVLGGGTRGSVFGGAFSWNPVRGTFDVKLESIPGITSYKLHLCEWSG